MPLNGMLPVRWRCCPHVAAKQLRSTSKFPKSIWTLRPVLASYSPFHSAMQEQTSLSQQEGPLCLVSRQLFLPLLLCWLPSSIFEYVRCTSGLSSSSSLILFMCFIWEGFFPAFVLAVYYYNMLLRFALTAIPSPPFSFCCCHLTAFFCL